jgi:hypothetical protein
MPNELIRPIDPDSAHAIEETAKATSKAIDAAVQAGKYVGEVLGDLPHDLVGIMGDWVKHRRARRWAELSAETLKILHARGVDNREDVSPSVAIPLIAAAINEDRNVLKQLWAKLLAAAMDPARSKLVRSSMIETVKQMDPLDALVLEEVNKNTGGNWHPSGRDVVKAALNVSQDEVLVSFEHLTKLECLSFPTAGPHINPYTTSLGRLLIQAIQP